MCAIASGVHRGHYDGLPECRTQVNSWHVIEDMRGETSDHQYVEVVLGTACQQVRRSSTGGEGEKRWALTKLDVEKLETALMVITWGLREEEGERDIHREVDWLRDNMHRICDEAMPRAKSPPPMRATYWWTDELAELRRSSVQARRAPSRATGTLRRERKPWPRIGTPGAP